MAKELRFGNFSYKTTDAEERALKSVLGNLPNKEYYKTFLTLGSNPTRNNEIYEHAERLPSEYKLIIIANFYMGNLAVKPNPINPDKGLMIMAQIQENSGDNPELQSALNYLQGYWYENGIGVTQNKVKALEFYNASARQGNSNAQAALGKHYMYMRGERQDLKLAFELCKKSADQHNLNGQVYLGQCYEHGIGVEKDANQAFELYKKAAEGGSPSGIFHIGRCYDCGIAVPQNQSVSSEFYKESAERGNSDGQYAFGKCLQFGSAGIQVDPKGAFDQFKKSADQGNRLAQAALGQFYEYGIGVEKDANQAFELYKKSAKQGNSTALYSLGRFHEFGLGGAPKDKAKALEYYQSAKQNNLDAQCALGRFQEFGFAGVKKDEAEALKSYVHALKSSKKRDQLTDCNRDYALGRCYELGLGTKRNTTKAFEFYKKSASENLPEAQLALGRCHENGMGTKKNPSIAFAIYTLLVNQGNVIALQDLGRCYEGAIGTKEDRIEAFKWYALSEILQKTPPRVVLGGDFNLKTKDIETQEGCQNFREKMGQVREFVRKFSNDRRGEFNPDLMKRFDDTMQAELKKIEKRAQEIADKPSSETDATEKAPLLGKHKSKINESIL